MYKYVVSRMSSSYRSESVTTQYLTKVWLTQVTKLLVNTKPSEAIAAKPLTVIN